MTEERKVQLSTAVDATGARQGFNEVKEAARDMAQAVGQAGQQAGKGLDGVGSSAEASAQKLDRATGTMSSAIKRAMSEQERLLAAMEAGGNKTSKFYESLSNARGADTSKLDPLIQKLRDLESQVSVAAAAEKNFAETRAFEKKAAEAAYLNKASEYVRFWEESLRKAEEAEKRLASQNGFLNSLKSQADAIGKTRADLLEMQAVQLGIADKAAPFISRLREAEAGIGRVGTSAAQTAAALRMVPAQFTDIVTSLQAGQAPMTVLLQQGGQLKDMFGGAGNAAKALGGYILGLVTPYTVAAGAVGALGFAYYQGSKEAEGLAKALILTGNAAGTSVNQLQNVAQSVSDLTGATRGAATETLQLVASSGKIAADNLGAVSEAAIRMERSTGRAIGETVKEFEELGRSPVEASLKLNQQYGYLTAEIFRQIRALEEQGRVSEAAALAQKTFADAMNERAVKITQSLGTLETAWKGLGDIAKSAWDKMLDIGREGSLEERLAKAREKLAAGGGWFSSESDARSEVAVLEAQLEATKKATEASAEQNKQEQARIKWLQEGEKYLTKREQQEREITRIRTEGAKAGASEAEIQRRVYEVMRADTQATLDARLSSVRESMSIQVALVQDAVKAGTKSEMAGIDAVKAARLKASQDELAVLSKKYASAQTNGEQQRIAVEIEKARAEARRAIADADVQIKELEEKHAAALGKFAAMATESLTPIQAAWQKFWNENSKIIEQAQQNGWSDVVDQMNKAWAAVADKTQFTQAKAEFDALFSEMQEKIEAVRQEAEKNGGFLASVSADQQAKAIKEQYIPALNDLIDKMREVQGAGPVNEKTVTDAVRATQKAANEVSPVWKKFTDDIERSLTDSLMRSFESGKGFGRSFVDSIKNTLKTAALKVAVQAVVSPVMSLGGQLVGYGLNALTGGASGGGGGGSNWFGMASNASSAYNLYNGSYAAAATNAWNDYIAGSTVGGYTFGSIGAAGAGVSGSVGSGGLAYGSGAAASGGLGVSGSVGSGGLAYGSAAAGSGSAGLGAASSSSAGSAGASSAGMSAATIAWVAAIIMGMKMSSDAWGAGIRADGTWAKDGSGAMQVWDNQYKIDKAMFGEKIAGSRIVAILSGNSLSRSIDQMIFGGRKSVEGSGVQGTFTYDNFDGDRYVDMHKSGGMFKKSKDWTEHYALSGGQRDYYQEAVRSLRNPYVALSQLAGGGDLSDRGQGFAYGFRRELYTQAQVEALLTDVSNALGQQLIPELVKFRQEGEPLTATAARMATVVVATNSLANMLGKDLVQAFGSLGVSSLDVRGALVDAAGGFDAFQSKIQTFYQTYFSQGEMLIQAGEMLSKEFEAVGLSMPSTKEAFRALVKGLDLTTAAGQSAFGTLMNVSGAFADFVDGVNSQIQSLQSQKMGIAGTVVQERDSLIKAILGALGKTGDLRTMELAGIDPLNRELARFSYALADAQAASQSLATAQQSLQDAQLAYASRLVNSGSNIAAFVRNLRAGLVAQSDVGVASAYQSDLASARTGDVTASERITASAQAYLESIRRNASSSTEIDIAMTRMAADLAALPAAKSWEESQAQSLEDIAATLQRNQAEAIAKAEALNKALIDVLTHGFSTFDTSLNGGLSLEELKTGLAGFATEAQIQALIDKIDQSGDGQLTSAELLAGSTAAVASNTAALVDGSNATIAELRQLVDGTVVNSSRLAALGQAILGLQSQLDNPNSATFAAVRQAVIDLGGVPTFARGGLAGPGWAVVGEEGPELVNFSSPGRVYTASQTAQALNGEAMAEMVAELRALRNENALLRAEVRSVATHTYKSSRSLAQVLGDGVIVRTESGAPLEVATA